MTRNQIKLTVPSDPTYLTIILDMVRGMANIMGFEQEDIYHLEVGTEEAVTNVLQYAFEEDEDASFDIILEALPLGLNILIREQGIPFDPACIHEYSKETLSKDLDQKGLGTFLMKQLFNEVYYHNLGKEGKETRLFKHLNNRQIHQLIPKEELAIVERAKSEEKLPKGSVGYSIRRMSPDEAVEVSKCAYSSYGYTYVHEDIYYPDRVRELNKTDNLISFIAVTDGDEIIAHSAFEQRDEDLAPELGVAFTKPKYRGQGCLNNLTTALLEEARQRNFVGIYARGVTTHPFSQMTLRKFGFKESALYLSSGAERTYKGGIQQKKPHRESVFIMFHYLNSPAEHIVYPPMHHREMIEEIYLSLGASPEIVTLDEPVEAPSGDSVVKIRTDPGSLTAHITVAHYGRNVTSEIEDNLDALCLQRLETIYLHLKLADKSTSAMTAEFEHLGFFFAGIMPSCDGNDEIVLQYLNNYLVDYGQLQTASGQGRQLLDYVKKRDPNDEK